jgi:hypothetical protein
MQSAMQVKGDMAQGNHLDGRDNNVNTQTEAKY